MLWWRKKSLWSCGNVRWVLLRWKGKFANEDYGWCKVLHSWHAEGIWCKGSCQRSFLAQYNFQVSMAMKKIRRELKKKEPQNPTQLIKNLFYKHNFKHYSMFERINTGGTSICVCMFTLFCFLLLLLALPSVSCVSVAFHPVLTRILVLWPSFCGADVWFLVQSQV